MITEHLDYCLRKLPETKDWFHKDDVSLAIGRTDWVLRRLEEEKLLERKVVGNNPYKLKTLFRKTKDFFQYLEAGRPEELYCLVGTNRITNERKAITAGMFQDRARKFKRRPFKKLYKYIHIAKFPYKSHVVE